MLTNILRLKELALWLDRRKDYPTIPFTKKMVEEFSVDVAELEPLSERIHTAIQQLDQTIKDFDKLTGHPDYDDALSAMKSRLRSAQELLMNRVCDLDGGECRECSQIVCPHGEPLHYHHDGCPACHGSSQ